MTARALPAALEAEQSVLSTALSDSSGIGAQKLVELLHAEHFYAPSHQAIFRAIDYLVAGDAHVDYLTVARRLAETHELEKLVAPRPDQSREEAGRDMLRELAADLPVLTRLPYHAKLIQDAWGKREIISGFTPAMQGVWNGVAPQEVLKQVEAACMALHGRVVDQGESKVVSALEAAQRAQERVQRPLTAEGAVPAPFGFLPDLMPGRLYVLGGYAKDGKTDVAIEALRQSCTAKVPTGFVSIEMPEAYLTDRIVATFGVPYGPLQRGVVAAPFREAWKHALGTIGLWPMQIHDDPATEIQDIVRFQRLHHFKFLIIDHLHEISYEEAYNPRMKISAHVKALSRLARTANIPVLLLAQLHRPPSSDGFPRPTMQSFKETGAIEQSASALWAIYRKRDPETGERLNDSRFYVLADRYGQDGAWRLQFNGAHQRFTPTEWRGA